VIEWLRGLWVFYLAYTKTGTHAAAAAGLAIFGLLVFVDDAFAVLAIAAYVLPPVILYVRADGMPGASESDGTSAETANGRNDRRSERPTVVTDGRAGHTTATARRRGGDGDTDSDGDDGDTDSDSDDGDSDSDRDDGDTDSDGDDGDTDSDSDN
jgi:hypothetical protein